MRSVTAINVESNEEGSKMCFKELFENLPKEKISKVKLQGSGVVKQATDNLQRFINLQYLEISATTDSAIINESVRSCRLLNELNLHAEGFSYGLEKIRNAIKVNLTIFIKETNEIERFVTRLKKKPTKPNVNTLKLCGNNLNSAVSSLGSLLLCLPRIQVLDVEKCGMTAHTLGEISDELTKEGGTKLDIKELILYANYLQNCGVYLQLILNHTPSLHTLNLYECYMNDDDVNNLAKSTACTHIKMIRFSNGCLQKEESIRRLVYSCHILEVLCLYYGGLGESPTLSCIQLSHLSYLRVLSLYSYNLSETAYGVFNNLQTLESLNVADCNMSDIQQLIQIIISLPFLTHLDVHDNKYGSDVLEITKRKHQMTNLHRLNIGPMSDKSGNRINEEDYVYCDQHGEDEDIWEMYIHDGD